MVKNSSEQLWRDVLISLYETFSIEFVSANLKWLILSNPELLTALETASKSCESKSTVLAILKRELLSRI